MAAWAACTKNQASTQLGPRKQCKAPHETRAGLLFSAFWVRKRGTILLFPLQHSYRVHVLSYMFEGHLFRVRKTRHHLAQEAACPQQQPAVKRFCVSMTRRTFFRCSTCF